jgi:uncharacterized protein (DUF433 family)
MIFSHRPITCLKEDLIHLIEIILKRNHSYPGACNGKPTTRSKCLTVHTLLSHLAAGESKAEIFESFPFLEKEDISAVLEYAN